MNLIHIISIRDKLQHININHLKIEVQDSFKKDEIIPTNSVADNDEDVINIAYLDENVKKLMIIYRF